MSTGCREQVIELLKKYSLGSPLIDERMMDWLRLFYTYARVDLQAQIAELKAENERLRMALADTEALEIGTAERCAKLTHQRDEYKADADRYRWLENNKFVFNGNCLTLHGPILWEDTLTAAVDAQMKGATE